MLLDAPHFWNSGTTTVHYLQEFRPALHIDELFQTLFALARDRKPDKRDAQAFLTFAYYASDEKELRIIIPSLKIQKVVFTLLAPLGLLMGFKSHYE